MASIFKKHGSILISIVTAIAILATAYLWKDTEYENAFFYVLAVGLILNAAFELYSKKADKDKSKEVN